MLAEGDRAPAFTLPDQDGNKVKLTDLKGEHFRVSLFRQGRHHDSWRSSWV
jgi:peroxiredoxin